MIDHLLPFLYALENLGNQTVALPDLDLAAFRMCTIYDKHRPAFLVTKQTTCGNLQHILLVPEDKTGLDAFVNGLSE